MTLEVSLRGVKCNLACSYCYQDPVRLSGNPTPDLDMVAVKAALVEEMAAGRQGDGFTVFGGEPLLAPLAQLEELWELGLKTAGKNGVQTNGALITDAHIEAFKKYKVHVGFSIDGPVELNRARWAGSPERTDAATEASIGALLRCLREGVGASLIVTLHRLNASPARLPQLIAWLESLAAAGLRYARAHALEADGPKGRALQLSREENVAAFRELQSLERRVPLRFDVFKDMLALLRGQDSSVTCTWNACDPWTTPAVRGVEADGTRTNCQRTNKDGVNWQKGEKTSYVRQLALYATPFEDGGCQGCRFFVMCKGQCPGTAIGGDWRNRSEDCGTWFDLFELLETRLEDVGEKPVSRRPDRAKIEAAMLESFARGQFMSVQGAVAVAEGKAPARGLGSALHGDTPHGDSHEDHTDTEAS
jgi:uncharacterized protein